MTGIDDGILRQIFDGYVGAPGFVFNTWEEFRDLAEKAYPLLVDAAKKETFITYGEVGGKIGLYVESEYFVLKIGYVVGACSKYERINGRPLISAIVVNATTQRPGPGFFGLSPTQSDLHSKTGHRASKGDDYMTPDMLVIWASEVKKVYEWWSTH